MSFRLLALCAAWLPSGVLAAVPTTRATMLAHLQILDRQGHEQRASQNPEREAGRADWQRQVNALAEQFARDGLDTDVDLMRKRAAVERSAWDEFESPRSAPERSILLPAERGHRCGDAIDLPDAVSLRADDMPVDGVLWLRFRASSTGRFRVHTDGSTIDTIVESYADRCPADEALPATSDDDGIGLQSNLGLTLGAGELQYLRVRNLGARGRLVVEATEGSFIRGSVNANLGTATAYSLTGLQVASSTIFQGRYTLSVDPGSYYVGASSLSTIEELYSDAGCSPTGSGSVIARCDIAHASPVVVDAGAVAENIDFTLTNGGRIVGRVGRAADGAAIPGAYITVYDGFGYERSSGSTDSVGRYIAPHLFTANYYVRASAPGYGSVMFRNHPCSGTHLDMCDVQASEPVAVVRDQDSSGVDIQLPEASSISGTVTFADGDASAYYSAVNVLDAAGLLVGAVNVGGYGRYTIGPLAPGDYSVLAMADGYYRQLNGGIDCATTCDDELPAAPKIHIAAQSDRPVVDLVLTPYPSVSGHVLEFGSGLAIIDSRISLLNETGSIYTQGYSAADGAFRLRHVRPGSYRALSANPMHADLLYPDVPCVLDASCDLSLGAVVTVETGATPAALDFHPYRSASISGTLRYRLPGDVLVHAAVPVRLYAAVGSGYRLLWSDSEGRFDFIDLPGGTYHVAAGAGPLYTMYPNKDCVDLPAASCDFVSGEAIVVADGESRADIDFSVISSATVGGRVADAIDGHPLAHAAVDLWRASPPFSLHESTETDGAGYYAFVIGSPANLFDVLITTDATGYINQLYAGVECFGGSYYAGTCPLRGGTPVSGATTTQTNDVSFFLRPADDIFHATFE